MTSDRNKPGVLFWATVVVVVVLVAYPLSFGPANHALTLLGDPEWALPVYWRIYAPIIWLYEYGPDPVHQLIERYCECCGE